MLFDFMKVNGDGHLIVSGCDTTELAREYGTPLYVMSEDEVRRACKSYVRSFAEHYGGRGKPIYASKAFCCKEICRIAYSEGLDLEVVSGGELYTAIKAGVPAEALHFHGNNKTPDEIEMAVSCGVGEVVADNVTELYMLNAEAEKQGKVMNISLRLKPGIDAHTHNFIRTGQIDSKFGIDLTNGEALEAVKLCLTMKNVCLKGMHCHIGSQIFDVEPFVHAANVMLDFYGELKNELGLELERLNLGGGFGCHYKEDDGAIPYEEYMQAVSSAVHEKCGALGIKTPYIFIEPGRSIVCEAGLTLYTVGSIREIEGVRNYVAIDGGMFENPRYALYQSDYTCLIANKADRPKDYTATIAGKCCESGDLIQEKAPIQFPEKGDILAVLSTGAYNYSMASNYNRNTRPACVMVSNGKARLIIRRESYEDLIRNDV